MAELPTGTVTFLFTDLEGSTRLWEEHPDAMQGALARHDEILRDAIAEHGGHVVKMTGDGAHAAFASADDAVCAALDAQLAFAAEDWERVGALRVRMGVHTGPADQRDGDYYGTAVNRAARLMSAAHGGQVIVSLATEEHLRDSATGGIELVDLGDVRLRDLSRPERVFQAVAPGLDADFPPLHSLDAFPGNLPVQVSSFVGRDGEISAIAKALDESRMVTLTGVGGVGKTRLAVQVAADVLPSFADGAWLCELAAARDVDSMVQLVAATLGVQPRQGSSFQGAILDFLRGKQLLLLLDNCEHLLAAAGDLADRIVRQCVQVRILATSREGLGVEGEFIRALRSLPVPAPGTDAETALGTDAVRLFADRAYAATGDFSLDASHALTVAEVCRRLDGVPLAIELAAARVSAMSPSEIAARLDERFRLLTGGRRTAVERHQTLRATVDWSYSLLTETEQLVFCRLGCFAGSFGAEAAQAVARANSVEDWDVLDALTSLVDKSMVVAERTVDGTRYAMLETLRQYALEGLDAAGDADDWRRAHADYYARFAEHAAAGIYGPEEFTWRPRVRAELDNLRAAVDWALDSDSPNDVELALRIIAALAFDASQDMTSGVGMWAVRAAPDAENATPLLRTAVLGAAAFQATFLGDTERSIEFARAAVRDGPPPDCHSVSLPYIAWGLSLVMIGSPEEAVTMLRDAHVALVAAGATSFALCGISATLSNMAVPAGDSATALDAAQQALLEARAAGTPSGRSIALYAYGSALDDTDPEAAIAAFDECVALIRAGASDVTLSPALAGAGLLRVQLGDRSGWSLLFDALRHDVETAYRPMAIGTIDRALRALIADERFEQSALLAGAVLRGPLSDVNHFRAGPPDLTSARSAYGEVAFDREVARGAEMSYDDLVAETLELLAQLGADTEAL
jgi:predicted ATPase/class 3 adenylate cyclase